MSIAKSHRLVLTRDAFHRMANLPSGAAMECAENEGWPIPADEREPPFAGVAADAIALTHTRIRESEGIDVSCPAWMREWRPSILKSRTPPSESRSGLRIRRSGRHGTVASSLA